MRIRYFVGCLEPEPERTGVETVLARLDENAAAFAEEAENLEEIRSDGVGGEDFFCFCWFSWGKIWDFYHLPPPGKLT